jgi:hypothetical protein
VSGADHNRKAEAAYLPLVSFHPDWLQFIIDAKGNPALYPKFGSSRLLVDGWYWYTWQWLSPGYNYTVMHGIKSRTPRTPTVRIKFTSTHGITNVHEQRGHITLATAKTLLELTRFLETLYERAPRVVPN